MKISLILRNKMLETVSVSLETPIITPTWERYIEFQELDDTPLCRLRYETVEEASGIGEDAAYVFKAADGTEILRGIVDLAGGTVRKFMIIGDTGDTISGTVGSIGSGSDIEFNMINWTVDVTSITISSLKLILPQGT